MARSTCRGLRAQPSGTKGAAYHSDGVLPVLAWLKGIRKVSGELRGLRRSLRRRLRGALRRVLKELVRSEAYLRWLGQATG